ncbi:MAG: hypothetical protein HY521_09720 [Proteobacteria bacterium]|nr:hypothetical protein [Pseudomonadota bacterium]
MYADNTLMPKEAVRLAALGVLAQGPTTYAAVATEVRHFLSRLLGPSLDLLGPSVELLRYEGLVEAGAPAAAPEAESLRITDKGQAELERLLRSGLRAPNSDLSKLVLALKLRFLHLLPCADRLAQAELFVEVCEKEIARLLDLRQRHAGEAGHLVAWLDHDVAALESRLAWFESLRDRIAAEP